MLELVDINKYYQMGEKRVHALNGINLSIEKGELVSITGASGSGKSTLLNVIGILDEYDSGSYRLSGKLIKNLSDKEAAHYRNQYLGFVFQSFQLIYYKTAEENVELPLLYKGIKRKKRKNLAALYMEQVGLGDRRHHKPDELSGGQKQRVAIARALVTNPELIIADEPTGALDSHTSQEILAMLKKLNKEGKTVLIVTHDQSIAAQCHRIIQLKDGETVNV